MLQRSNMKSNSIVMSLAGALFIGALGLGCAAPVEEVESDTSAAAIESDCRKSVSDPVTTGTAKLVAGCMVQRGTGTDAAGTLASLFDSATLNYNFATDSTAGGRPASRLDFVLGLTNDGRTGFSQFAAGFTTDTGFNATLKDGFLYTNKWSPGEVTNQTGHFLTAVAMGYNPDSVVILVTALMGRNLTEDARLSALRMIVGHEMTGDGTHGSAGRAGGSPTLTSTAACTTASRATRISTRLRSAKRAPSMPTSRPRRTGCAQT